MHKKMLKQHTFTKKIENLSKEQGRLLFNLHGTVKLFQLDIMPPKNLLDTLALGPKNPVLENLDQRVSLAETDVLLNHLQDQNVSTETYSDINIATMNYLKKCSKYSQKFGYNKKYLKEHNLLAIQFDKGTKFCPMKCHIYEN